MDDLIKPDELRKATQAKEMERRVKSWRLMSAMMRNVNTFKKHS